MQNPMVPYFQSVDVPGRAFRGNRYTAQTHRHTDRLPEPACACAARVKDNGQNNLPIHITQCNSRTIQNLVLFANCVLVPHLMLDEVSLLMINQDTLLFSVLFRESSAP